MLNMILQKEIMELKKRNVTEKVNWLHRDILNEENTNAVKYLFSNKVFPHVSNNTKNIERHCFSSSITGMTFCQHITKNK